MTSLKELASVIFNNPPLEPNSCSLLNDNDDTDPSYVFEMLITIYMEGMMVIYNDLENVNFDMINKEHLESIKPWLLSFGINLTIKEDYDDDYYCKIIINGDPKYKYYFTIHNTNKYHFFFNNKFFDGTGYKYPTKRLNEITAIFICDKTYTLQFMQFVQ